MRTMVIGILLVGFALSGCKTADEYAGSGPLVITQRIKNFLDAQTQKAEGMVAVAYNGTKAQSYTCPSGIGCQPDSMNPIEVIDGCERRAPRCALYSYNGHVVWKGPISVGTPSAPVSLKTACNMAVVTDNGVVTWDNRKRYAKYVARAKAEGMSPKECDAMTK